ncbi:site-2 protease family protein [Patescibacteria group bacterium]|nr:site-2 protease family protein [Patescibacteria group bacterium]
MFFTIITFAIVLAVIVLVHEWGHFTAARIFGVKVEEFGFGFPPRIWGKKKGDTTYSLNWIPLGGFVKIKGEGGENKDDKDSFSHQAAWKRAVILCAGVFMNIVLAIVLLSIGFMIGLPSVVEDDMSGIAVSDQKIQIVEVSPETVASSLDLKAGDEILTIDNQNFESTLAMTEYIKNDEDGILNIEIARLSGNHSVIADLTDIEPKVLGVYLADTGLVKYPWWQAIINGFKATWFILVQIVVAFYSLLKSLILGTGSSLEVAGPVGVAVITGQMARLGIAHLLQFTALFSLNLAVINIVPFPALDGGRLLFVGIEKLRRKPNNETIETVIHNIGFIILLLLIFVITYKDIAKYSGQIMGAIGRLFS